MKYQMINDAESKSLKPHFRWLGTPILILSLPLLACYPVHAQGPQLEQVLIAEPLSDIASDAREKGDPSRGAVIFHSPGTGCAKCHSTAEETGFGPNLSIWKRKVDDNHLVESVLKPSAQIQPEFQNLRVLTTDGRTILGIEADRTVQTLKLQTGPGNAALVKIPLEDIEAEKKGEVSVMPAGQVNALRRRQEFLDLISYLIAIRGWRASSCRSTATFRGRFETEDSGIRIQH